MTMGVYELKFTDGSTYIGQSVNILKRLRRHMLTLSRGDHHNWLVQTKFLQYGAPITSILEECQREELLHKEILYVNKISKNLLLNISEAGQKTCVLQGELNGRSKYTNEDILDILFALSNSDISKKELAEFSPVSYTMIRQIASGSTHSWMKDIYPIEYNLMLSKIKKAKVFKIKDPKGNIHEVTSQRAFVKSHDISLSSLNHLATGKILSAKGWKLV